MNTDSTSTHTTAFRLTREALQRLATLARRVGLPRGSLLEILIRERAQQEHLNDASSLKTASR